MSHKNTLSPNDQLTHSHDWNRPLQPLFLSFSASIYIHDACVCCQQNMLLHPNVRHLRKPTIRSYFIYNTYIQAAEAQSVRMTTELNFDVKMAQITCLGTNRCLIKCCRNVYTHPHIRTHLSLGYSFVPIGSEHPKHFPSNDGSFSLFVFTKNCVCFLYAFFSFNRKLQKVYLIFHVDLGIPDGLSTSRVSRSE